MRIQIIANELESSDRRELRMTQNYGHEGSIARSSPLTKPLLLTGWGLSVGFPKAHPETRI